MGLIIARSPALNITVWQQKHVWVNHSLRLDVIVLMCIFQTTENTQVFQKTVLASSNAS